MTHTHKGSVIGGALLVTGSCIGAGMLGLPIITGLAGFFPSLLSFLCAFLFMTSTALLLIEIIGYFDRPVNLLSMVEGTIGKVGKLACWLLYLFLFYAILVAYIANSGIQLSTLVPVISPSIGSILFVLFFGWVVFLGTRIVDLTNRFLMFGKIAAYLGVILIGSLFFTPTNLHHSDPILTIYALPLLVISFGFHNMIPSLAHYLQGNLRRLFITIISGSLLTLLIYLIWEFIALGVIPYKGDHGVLYSYTHGIDGATAIRLVANHPLFGSFAFSLAFFGILTSFLAQTLSLVHFLRDGFKIESGRYENPWLCVIALLPPLIFALVNPTIFYSALNFAGGICAVILFGLLPVLMVWQGRKKFPHAKQIIKGKIPLILIFSFALSILLFQLAQLLGFSFHIQ